MCKAWQAGGTSLLRAARLQGAGWPEGDSWSRPGPFGRTRAADVGQDRGRSKSEDRGPGTTCNSLESGSSSLGEPPEEATTKGGPPCSTAPCPPRRSPFQAAPACRPLDLAARLLGRGATLCACCGLPGCVQGGQLGCWTALCSIQARQPERPMSSATQVAGTHAPEQAPVRRLGGVSHLIPRRRRHRGAHRALRSPGGGQAAPSGNACT